MLNRVTVSVLATSRWTTRDDNMSTAIEDATSYREMLTAAQQRKSTVDMALPWSRNYNWLWRYQLGPEYHNASPRLMVEMLVPLVRPIQADVRSEHLEGVEAQLMWHPFAVTTVAHLWLRGDSWHTGDPLATTLRAVLRSFWDGTVIQARNGLPVPAAVLARKQDAACRPSSLNLVSTAMVISELHHAEKSPGPLAYSLASLVERSAADKSASMHIDGSHLAVTDARVGIVVRSSMANAERRHHCLHANATTLLALIENLRTLQGATGQYGDWYRDTAETVLRHLYRRTDHPSARTVYKSRLAQVWLDSRGLGPTYTTSG
jgi:hypothetical protein